MANRLLRQKVGLGAIAAAVATAKGARVTLADGEPPKDKAFYRVVVSVP